MVKDIPANAGDVKDRGLIPGLGRYPGGGHGNPLQYTCLEKLMDRGAWWATDHGWQKATESLSRHTCIERPREGEVLRNSLTHLWRFMEQL